MKASLKANLIHLCIHIHIHTCSWKGTTRGANLGRKCAEFQFPFDGHKRSANVQVSLDATIHRSIRRQSVESLSFFCSRLNYPLKMRQWHHMCSSWNGKTGEWQAWLKAERIGRGFHNSVSLTPFDSNYAYCKMPCSRFHFRRTNVSCYNLKSPSPLNS